MWILFFHVENNTLRKKTLFSPLENKIHYISGATIVILSSSLQYIIIMPSTVLFSGGSYFKPLNQENEPKPHIWSITIKTIFGFLRLCRFAVLTNDADTKQDVGWVHWCSPVQWQNNSDLKNTHTDSAFTIHKVIAWGSVCMLNCNCIHPCPIPTP